MLTGTCFTARAQSANQARPSDGSQPSYAISVAGPTGPIKLGTPITVKVTVTNISQRDLYWQSELGKDSAYRSFTFLLSKNGHEAETTHFHRRLSGRQREGDPVEVPGSGSSILLPHPPGKMFEIPIDVTRLYQITEPGAYTFRVCRHDEASKTMVCSNDLTLRIQP
jgi:hypothetical protein